MNESCHTSEWVMARLWMSHVWRMSEPCHTYAWSTRMSHVAHLNESCHTYGWVMSKYFVIVNPSTTRRCSPRSFTFLSRVISHAHNLPHGTLFGVHQRKRCSFLPSHLVFTFVSPKTQTRQHCTSFGVPQTKRRGFPPAHPPRRWRRRVSFWV